MSDSTLQWKDTPNPPPHRGETFKWTTNAERQDELHWRSSNEEVVKITLISSDAVTLQVVGSGSSLIIACRPGESPICRYVSVGTVFAYDKDKTLRKAPSEVWLVSRDPDQVRHLPRQLEMTSRHACVAYNHATGDLVLNFDELANLVKDCNRTTYFRAATPPSGGAATTTASQANGIRTWAYSTDGTLWQLSGLADGKWAAVSEKEKKELPPDFPLVENFKRSAAALVWSPDPDSGAEFCVTCFILNQDVFELGKYEMTYFPLEKLPDTPTT